MSTVETGGGDVPSRQRSTDQPSETISVDALFEQAGSLHAQGKLDRARQLYLAVLQENPEHIGSLHNLGILCFQCGRYDDTVALTREVVRLRPDLAVAHNTLGVALRRLGRLEKAEASCREAVRLQPNYAEAHNTLGDVLTALRRPNEAEASCREAVRLAPEYAEAHNNLGTALAALGRSKEAEICCREALRLKPGDAAAHNNLATVLVSLGRAEEAEACCREALRLQPGYAEAHINLATALIALGRAREAEACCREALRLKPGNAEALHNLGTALSRREKLSEAAAYFAQAAALKPVDADVLVGWIYLRQEICDWSRYRADETRVRSGIGRYVFPGAAFRLLAFASTPEEQLASARQIAAKIAAPISAMVPSLRQLKSGERLRLGYFSANFHAHAGGSLIAGLIERHDRRRFEVIAYGFDEDDGSAMRRRLVAAFDRFVDIAQMPDRDAADLIRADGIDILIDLHGWFTDGRPEILAHRPAPIQVSFLYPGTTGADFFDYIVADQFVMPPDEQCFFSERLVYLPDCFQCNDDKREIAERTPSRGECGLPEQGFVFCCFGNSWKLSPDFFDIWMRLLAAVPQSVLWLYEANPLMKANLARESETRRIAPERLVFAPRLPPAEHLARHRLADLFLDTLPYNAHTTASDALWTGLPVLTCTGSTFAGRVAGSLLRAVGLDELVTTSLPEYEGLALQLARDAKLMNQMRARLAQNRLTHPLFDTVRYTRNLEAAYWRMGEIRKAGHPPTAFSVPPSGYLS